MKDCTGISCKMKTYKELKEQVLEENLMNTAQNAVMGTKPQFAPTDSMYKNYSRQGGVFGQGGLASQGMGLLKNNKGLIGAGLAGVAGVGLLTGLIRQRQGRRDNSAQSSPIPAPNIKQTTVNAPGSVGIPSQRVNRAVQQIEPKKPIDNRTTSR
jgi:hypothetical protein